jgi:glyoxylase-like metal-dependent hydrolase (beta-lactamase superfamily II)
MQQEMRIISLPLPYKLGNVNCYLIKTAGGYVLIDTALPKDRANLEKELENAGCRPGSLRLIIMTHGDLDHTGNGAYLRKKYSAKIAMHRYDSGVVENGDDTLSRGKKTFLERIIGKLILNVLSPLMRFGKFERFRPDILLDDGYDLSEYGFGAKVLYIPGHSKGSIGILTIGGDLFCGDLLWNIRRPATQLFNSYDREELKASVAKLKNLRINMVYPGHGKPFAMDTFLTNN